MVVGQGRALVPSEGVPKSVLYHCQLPSALIFAFVVCRNTLSMVKVQEQTAYSVTIRTCGFEPADLRNQTRHPNLFLDSCKQRCTSVGQLRKPNRVRALKSAPKAESGGRQAGGMINRPARWDCPPYLGSGPCVAFIAGPVHRRHIPPHPPKRLSEGWERGHAMEPKIRLPSVLTGGQV